MYIRLNFNQIYNLERADMSRIRLLVCVEFFFIFFFTVKRGNSEINWWFDDFFLFIISFMNLGEEEGVGHCGIA